ncbi:putative ubiquitin supergroup [Diplodia seriata]|uniref:Putative ubiquitin supergroup n=1 Tax=Diplodia seriata TaxID=420778 RepID=A0A0G2G485_9PEZI|nr:putative ubiquitin supergroup [Diplodia seriata]
MTELSFAKQFLTALEARPARLSSDHVVDPKSYPAQPAFILPRMPQPKRKPTTRTTTDAAAAADQPTTTAETTTATETDLVTVTLKPPRPTPTLSTYTLPTPVSPATTSMHDLKAAYAASTGQELSTGKIKVLYAKKPVSDTKTIKDVLGAAGTTNGGAGGAVEFSIMVLGGGAGAGTAGTPTSTGTPAISTPERLASPPVAAPSQPEIEMGEAPPVAVAVEGEGGAAAAMADDPAFWADLKGFLVQRLKDEAEGERLAGVFREAWAQQRQE